MRYSKKGGLCLSAKRKKNRGLNFTKNRGKLAAPTISQSVEVSREAHQYHRGQQGHMILPHNSDSSSYVGTSLDASCKETSFTPMSYLPYSDPSCEVNINQETNQNSFFVSEHSLPIIRDSYSVNPCRTSELNFKCSLHLSHQCSSNHLPSPQAIKIEQEPGQDSCSASKNLLPSIKDSFSLNPIETPDSAVCCVPTDNKNSLETRFDLLAKNWAEKMKSLSNDQRIYAEKLINDVFFLAEVGHLRHVCKDGELWLKIEK